MTRMDMPHRPGSAPRRRLVVATAMAVTAAGGALSVAVPQRALAVPTVSGVVFEDFDADGARTTGSITPGTATAADVGVANALVTVTDSTGAVLGTANTATNASGAFSVPVGAASGSVRVVVTPPAGFTAGPHGSSSGTTVQFVTVGSAAAADVEVGLSRAGDYSVDRPTVLNVEQRAAINASGTLITPSTQPTLISTPYATRGVNAGTTKATADLTGSIWGVAQLNSSYAFTSAFVKRHARIGPGGVGAIYLTDLGAADNATTFATDATAGSDGRTGEAAAGYDWFHDAGAYAKVGKDGFGGIALAPDNSALYAVNLSARSLFEVPITLSGAGVPTAGTTSELPLPVGLPGAATGCADAQVRPFGLTEQNGALWVTLTCTGPAAADLRGYVYRYDLSSGTFGSAPAFETALSGYSRGFTYTGCPGANPCSSAWNPWPADSDTSWPVHGTQFVSRPEPELSDVAFDANGDMSIGIKDRFGDQASYHAGSLTTSDTTTYEGFPGGDLLRACGTEATGWTLEANAVCGTRTGALAGNAKGPGGGEFYNETYSGGHDHTSLGALLQIPGYGDVQATAYDTLSTVRTNGVRFLSNASGGNANNRQITNDTNNTTGDFGKAGGLGDIAALVGSAPLEIGNRVWIDANDNGQQDAAEASVSGVTVHLYAADGTTLLATAVTATDGTYYFSSGSGTSTASAVYGVSGLSPSTGYVVRIDNPSDFASGGPLVGYAPAKTAAGNDRSVDSNGALVGGVDQAALTTGAVGGADHTIDFGFQRSYAVGDFVWQDTDRNGVQDTGEPGVNGVTATLLNAATGLRAVHPDGTSVGDVLTAHDAVSDTDGHYAFDDLAAGDYQVQFSTLPAGYVLTTQNAAAGSATTDSNPAVSTAVTPTFTLGPVGSALPRMRTTTAADQVTAAAAIDPSIDAGLVLKPAVSVGDFVWFDTNHDGVQRRGEPGINGVTVGLRAPGGGTVTDIFGQPVAPVVTARNGSYLFGNLPTLPAGQSYTVTVDNSQAALAGAGYLPTVTGGTSDTALDSSTSTATSGDLSTNGASDRTLDFGFIKPAVSVGDFVWSDTNHDGIQQSGEPGIDGVTVTLTGPGGGPVTTTAGTDVGPATTSGGGAYSFGDLPALAAGQSYTVHVDNSQAALTSAGYLPTTPGAGSDRGLDSSTGSADSTGLTTDGAADPTLDFGFIKPAVGVGDFVWSDTNHDGVQQPGEPGIPGVTVTVTGPGGVPVTDVNGNAVSPQVTGSTGTYLFTNLPALAAGQSYTVHVDDAQAALAGAGYTPTETGGTPDPAADSSTGSASSGDLTSDGQSDRTLDFGFIRPAVTVGDFVWSDTNRNGVQDAGEPGIPGVVVTLSTPGGGPVTDTSGQTVGPVTTGPNGAYQFAGLPVLTPGQAYVVHVSSTQPALDGFASTIPGSGTDRAKDSSTGSAASGPLLTDGASDLTLDFGFTPPTYAVGDFVWRDGNRNGGQDSGEPGVPGVTVTLLDGAGAPARHADGSPVAPVRTDPAGHYAFDFLAAGNYQAVFSGLPVGYQFTAALVGAQAFDSNPDLTGRTPLFTLGFPGVALPHMRPVGPGDGTGLAYAIDPTIDAGIVLTPTVSVGDFVWRDGNGNGLQDRGEPGVRGVTVSLTGPTGAAVTDIFGHPVRPATTDAHGGYTFTGLLALRPGQSYTVHVNDGQRTLAGAGLSPTRAGAGRDRGRDSSTGSARSGSLTRDGASDRSLDFGFVTGTAVKGSTTGRTPVTVPTGRLAFTGAEIGGLLVLGAALTGLGGLMVAGQRRRRLPHLPRR